MDKKLNKMIVDNKRWSRGKKKAIVEVNGVTGKVKVYRSLGEVLEAEENKGKGLYRTSISQVAKGCRCTAGIEENDYYFLDMIFDIYFGI